MTNRLLIIPVGFIAVLFLAALLLAGSYMLQNFERLNFSTHSDHRDRLNGLLEKLDREQQDVQVFRTPVWDRLVELENFTRRVLPDKVTDEILDQLEELAKDVEDGLLSKEQLDKELNNIEINNLDKFRPADEEIR